MYDSGNTFLTIAIPTYNRPQAIQRQVRNLLPQLIPGKTRLLVYDNASPIPVETLFTDEEKSLFIIHRNCVNIGGASNVSRCLEACCNSEWGYVPGDDDDLFPDTIVRILEQIENNPDTVFINFGCTQEETIENEDEFLTSLNQDVFSFGDALWLSKGIYHTKLLSDFYSDLYQYGYSYAPHIVFILSYFKKNKHGTVIRLKTPLFKSGEPGGWSPFVFAQRLMSFYYYYGVDSNNNHYSLFLHNIAKIQLNNIFFAIHKRPDIPSPSSRDVRFLLKQILCCYSLLTCLRKTPFLFLDALLYSFSPLIDQHLYSLYYNNIKKIIQKT